MMMLKIKLWVTKFVANIKLEAKIEPKRKATENLGILDFDINILLAKYPK